MSKTYRQEKKMELPLITAPELRQFCQRPGKMDKDGKPIYTTEQAHKMQCDVNSIIAKYDKQGVIQHVSRFEADYGDMTGLDFKTAQDTVINAQKQFDALPSDLRKYFQNSPQALLTFMEDEGNRDKAIELGLISKEWTPESDGLGEHVKKGENVKIPVENTENK